MEKCIWTVGHSTYPIEDFMRLLHSNNIKSIADIRRFPRSMKFPQYNIDAFKKTLADSGIEYNHLEALGGRRNPRRDSRNTGWRVAAFRGYADYMETNEFQNAITSLEQLGLKQRLAYLCSEAVWWSCHRALVSDFLKHRGWTVFHIMTPSKVAEHPWTKPARIEKGELNYKADGMLDF